MGTSGGGSEPDTLGIVLGTGEIEAARRARKIERRSALAVGTAMIALLISGAVVMQPWRASKAIGGVVASASATPISDLTQLSEDAKWGRVWSVANGVPVVRPMWLPPAAEGYASLFSVDGGTSGLMSYRFSYYAIGRATPGTAVRSIELMAVREPLPVGFVRLDAPPEPMTVHGHPAELRGAERVPLWEISWSNLGYRYGVEVFGCTRGEALRIVSSLADVRDPSGQAGP